MCFALRVWGSVYFDTLCFLKINARIKKNCQPNIQVANAVSREQTRWRARAACCGLFCMFSLGPECRSAQSSGHLQSNFLFKTRHFADRLAIGCFACVYVGWEMGWWDRRVGEKSQTRWLSGKKKWSRIFNKCLKGFLILFKKCLHCSVKNHRGLKIRKRWKVGFVYCRH